MLTPLVRETLQAIVDQAPEIPTKDAALAEAILDLDQRVQALEYCGEKDIAESSS